MPGASFNRVTLCRPSWQAFLQSLPSRVAAHWRIKLILAVSLSIFFCVPYFWIGHYLFRSVHALPLTRIDQAIGFHPYAWVWIYQSIYLPLNIVPWLAERSADLRRYTIGFVVISLISFAIFIAYPIRGPKPPVPSPTGMYWLLLQYDAPLNSLPSLHASLLVFTLAFGKRILKDQMPRGLWSILIIWTLLILYGTLATKEHYLLDIVAGAALALAVDWFVRKVNRSPQPLAPPAEPLPAES